MVKGAYTPSGGRAGDAKYRQNYVAKLAKRSNYVKKATKQGGIKSGGKR